MALADWSTVAADNATKPGINWAEGMAPRDINNSARQMMADIAQLLQPSLTGGAALTKFLQSGVGASLTEDVQKKLRLVIDAQDFSAVGEVWDGVYDNTATVQEAVNEAIVRGGATVILPPLMSISSIAIGGRCSIRGVDSKTRITARAGNYTMFSIQASDVSISNLYIDDAAKTGGWDFIIACGTGTIVRTRIDNVLTLSSYGTFTDSGTGTSAAGSHITTIITNIQSALHRGPGVQFTRAFAFVWFERAAIDFVNVAASNFAGFFFSLGGLGGNAGGLTMIDCDVLGTMGVYNNAGQNGYEIRNTAAVWMVRCKADTVAGIGFLLFNVNATHQEGCVASLCGSHGFWLEIVYNSTFVDLIAAGRNYLAAPGTGSDGVRIVGTGCYSLNFVGGLVSSWALNGFNKTGAQAGSIRVTGMAFLSNGLAGVGYGVYSVGNSAFHVVGCGFAANVQGNYFLNGTFDYLGMCQLNSGVGNFSAGPGPISG